MGLAAAFLGREGQPSGTLLQLTSEKASVSELKPILLEMKTQVRTCLRQRMNRPPQRDRRSSACCMRQGPSIAFDYYEWSWQRVQIWFDPTCPPPCGFTGDASVADIFQFVWD